MKNLFFFFAFAFVAAAATAQTTCIYFDYAKADLTKDAHYTLDSMMEQLPQKAADYRVQLIGHTDSDGNIEYNQALSLQRCEAAKSYLLKKGVVLENMKIEGRNFVDSVMTNQSDKGKALNRRVEMRFSLINPKTDPNQFTVKVVKKGLQIDIPKQTETFTAEKGITTTYKSGTIIRIPSNILVHADGSPVKGDVQLEYYEMRDAADFIASGIPMDFKGSIFNSAGMFEINVFQNGEKLSVKPGAYYDMEFAKTGDLPSLGFYKYDRATNEWTGLGKLDDRAESFNTATDVYCYRPNNGFRITALDTVNTFRVAVEIGVEMSKNAGLIKEYSNGKFLNLEERFNNLKYTDTLFLDSRDWRKGMMRIQTAAKLANSSLEYTDDSKTKVLALDNTPMEVSLAGGDSLSELAVIKKYKWLYLKKGETYELSDMKAIWTDGNKVAAASSDLNKKKNPLEGLDTISEIVDAQGYLFSQKRQWRDIRLEYVGAGVFNFVVKGDQIRRFKVHADVKGSAKQVEKTCLKIMEEYNAALAKRSEKFDKKMAAYKANWDYFMDYSKPFFTRNEACMSVSGWFNYFHENHGTTMDMRYKRLATVPLIADSIALALSTGALPPVPMDPATELGQGLRLNGFGVYNCDQIMRLGNAIEVTANYTLPDGSNINPTSLYAVDYNLNTAMTFDVHRFSINPKSETALFLTDDKGNSYMVRAQVLKLASPQDKKHYTLVAEDLTGKIKNTEDLRRELGLVTR